MFSRNLCRVFVQNSAKCRTIALAPTLSKGSPLSRVVLASGYKTDSTKCNQAQQTTQANIVIEKMDRYDAPALFGLARQEFPVCLHEVETFYETDPDGFYAAMDHVTGEVMGYCGGVRMGPDVAYVSCLVVKPQFRQLGVGERLMQFCLNQHKADNVAGNMVQKVVEKKLMKDFTHKSMMIVEFLGKLNGDIGMEESSSDRENDPVDRIFQRPNNPVLIVPLADLSESDVQDYDTSINTFPRPQFFERNYLDQRFVNIGAVSEGKIQGIAHTKAIRKADDPNGKPQKYRIGPLYAENMHVAKQLLSSSIESIRAQAEPGVDVSVFVPMRQSLEWRRFLLRNGFKTEFDITRVYTKDVLALPWNRVFSSNFFSLT